jgi:hypothetical protein
MRTADEVRAERDRFRRLALDRRYERERRRAFLDVVIVLSWVLGETSGPTARVKLD